MASLHRTAGGTFNLSFRYLGKQYLRSLETKNETDARDSKTLIEKTLRLLKDGVLTLSDGVSPDQFWQFLRSGGKVNQLPKIAPTIRLDKLCNRYLKSFGKTGKEATTLDTEQHHVNHFQRLMGKATFFASIGSAELREYVSKRETEKGTHGRKVQPVTIAKELQTYRQVWEFAKSEACVSGENPVGQVKKPRGNEKPPFMAWDEIETRVARGGLTAGEIAELWECLFLREHEIGEFLDHVKAVSRDLKRFPYIYPAVAFCAYTGARRSEMFRCRIDDVNGKVLLSEKKKSQDQRMTFREVPLHPELEPIISGWLQGHPGGQFMFCKNNSNALDDKTSREAFRAVTKGSKWKALRGYHVLRHSFCSNLARHGVDEYKIDAFMGHQTIEMRRRYRHLFPEDRESAIAVMSFKKPGFRVAR